MCNEALCLGAFYRRGFWAGRLAAALLAILHMGGRGNEGNWRGRLVVLDMDAADELAGLVVVPY